MYQLLKICVYILSTSSVQSPLRQYIEEDTGKTWSVEKNKTKQNMECVVEEFTDYKAVVNPLFH